MPASLVVRPPRRLGMQVKQKQLHWLMESFDADGAPAAPQPDRRREGRMRCGPPDRCVFLHGLLARLAQAPSSKAQEAACP